ncbi:MAG: hypothetical protein KatS3mg030_079 [Saprospiraceae bacterium]|nr:MAG: hypothetical protein KatS3mg030_079 [Saprospiraceae bacterium]
METGLFLGFANYQGDLSDNQIVLKETKKSFGGFVRLHYEDKLKIRGNVYYGFIGGDDLNADSDKKFRKWKFDGEILEIAITGEYHPFGRSRAGNTGIFRRQISPYIATGLGYTISKIDLSYPDADAHLFPEPADKDTFSVRAFDARRQNRLARDTSPSALNGVGEPYSPTSLDDVAENGNPNRRDWYLFVGGSLSYFFGSFTPDYFKTEQQMNRRSLERALFWQ